MYGSRKDLFLASRPNPNGRQEVNIKLELTKYKIGREKK